MEDSPLISVVTVCHNSAEFIEQCMQSVIGQEYPGVDYLVIDGGSTDGTVDIIRRHADKLSYWHSKPDRGIGHAFNLGVEKSRGDWLMFLNSDDYLLDQRALSTLAKEVSEHPNADVVYGMVAFVTRERDPRATGMPYGEPFNWKRFVNMRSIPHPAAVTSRRFIEQVGPFDESYRIAMDYEHFLRGGPALRARFVPRVVTCMRLEGASRRNRSTVLNEWFRAIVSHRVLSFGHACLLYTYYCARTAIGNMLRRRIT
jgi:glycosyltransferase involved in cell wall biosynthesis